MTTAGSSQPDPTPATPSEPLGPEETTPPVTALESANEPPKNGTGDGNGTPLKPDESELYQAIRAHEVMLNEAAAAQERSVLAPLLTLNGGAAIAFLTLMGAKASLGFDLEWARGAVAAWMFGLLLAAAAGWAGSRNQKSINLAYRLMRERVELRLFPELGAIVALPAPDEPEGASPDHQRAVARKTARDKAGRWGDAFMALCLTSAAAFVLGGVFATLAVKASPSVPEPDCHDARHWHPGSASDSDCA